jgi:hypothetical protein
VGPEGCREANCDLMMTGNSDDPDTLMIELSGMTYELGAKRAAHI